MAVQTTARRGVDVAITDILRTPIDVPGPWTHRLIAANGAQFHIAEMGDGPLIVLVHGFPEFWWAWRHHMPALAEAGWRVAAMDMRGYGSSDKPPRGYDAFTLAADITGVIRSLGERQAVVVGHNWGALGAWTAATLRPAHIRGLAAISMPHPLVLRRQILTGQLHGQGYLLSVQAPIAPERKIVADGGAHVVDLLRTWSAVPSFPDKEAAKRYRSAMQLWPSPHCALEHQRWFIRSLFRADGRRFAKRLNERVAVPTLHIHGTDDPKFSAKTAAMSRQYVSGEYHWLALNGVGHFPHEEAPEQVTHSLLTWLQTL